jgi:hypothetical protein
MHKHATVRTPVAGQSEETWRRWPCRPPMPPARTTLIGSYVHAEFSSVRCDAHAQVCAGSIELASPRCGSRLEGPTPALLRAHARAGLSSAGEGDRHLRGGAGGRGRAHSGCRKAKLRWSTRATTHAWTPPVRANAWIPKPWAASEVTSVSFSPILYCTMRFRL